MWKWNSIRLAEEINVYQAEVLAIKPAVRKLLEIRKTEFKFIKIFSDSQAALRLLASWKIKSKLFFEIITALNFLTNCSLCVELVWVKAHNNYQGNERADELARNSVYNNEIQFSVDPPKSFFKKELKEGIYKI